MNRTTVMSRHGFTLIELLVVIAIISLLVSILIPSLNRAKRIVRETLCASNIHGLTLASMLYAESNDGWLPEMATDLATGDHSRGYHLYWIQPYWRRRFRTEYGVERDMFYSPCNDRWNRDNFYYNGTNCIIGYFCFGGYDLLESKAFRSGLQTSPPEGTAFSLFPQRLGRRSSHDMLWTDLNRQWPLDYWVTPDDPNRWGANHLYSNEWPSGSHVGHLDASVNWKPGEDLMYGAYWNGVGYFW